MLNNIYFALTLKWMAIVVILTSGNGNDVPDNFILVKTFSRNIFWVPIDDPSSSQELTISNVINNNSGLIYNYPINRILLADDDNIWSMPFNDTETQFANVSSTLVYDIALDPSNGNVYFGGNSDEIGGGVIGVVDSSSSEITLIFETSSPSTTDIVLDHRNQLLFWIAFNRVVRGGMDGSDMTTIQSPSSELRGLAIDTNEEQLYWTLGDTIYSCDYQGQGQAIFYQDNGAVLKDVKVLGNFLYYVYDNYAFITRVNKHNTSDVHLIGPVSGLTNADRLDVYISSEYEILCSNADIIGVQLPDSCTLRAGESCNNFTCEHGYEKKQAVTSLNCTESGTWNQNVSSLCIEIPDNLIVVKAYSPAKVFWIPIDDPGSSQSLAINPLSDPQAGVLYNFMIHRILLPEYSNIWKIPVDGDTKIIFADVDPVKVQGLTLHPTTGDVYFIGQDQPGTIKGVVGLVNSSNGESSYLCELSGETIRDIVLDHLNQYIFWVSANFHIKRSSMDGSNITTILSENLLVRGLAIDHREDRLYYIKGARTIYSSDLEGQDVTTFYQDNTADLKDLKILGDYLYFIDPNNDSVTRVHKQNISDVYSIGPVPGLTQAERLDVYISSEYESCNANDLVNVQWPTRCSTLKGDPCSEFTCDSGYKRNESITTVMCTEAGTWSHNASTLCIEIFCSNDDIANAQLPASCSSKAGESCDDFTCQDGFDRNPVVFSLHCSESGIWNHNLSTICIELPDIFLLVKTFTGQVYWIPADDPGSSQTLDINTLSDPIPGIYYNRVSDKVMLPENNNIWQMSIFDDTKTLFADVGSYEVSGLAIHPTTGDVYFSGNYSGVVKALVGVINSSDGQVSVIHEQMNSYKFRDIVLDYEHQSLYWIYNDKNIMYSPEMKSIGTQSIQQRTVLIRALDIDLEDDRLYWIEGAGNNDIYSCDLEGKDLTIFLEANSFVYDLKVFGYYLYYIERTKNIIYRVNKQDSTDVYEIGPISGLTLPEHLEVYTETGYATSCESGDLVHVQVSASCSTKKGESCNDFSCDYGYQKNENVTSVTCSESGSWSLNGSDLCIEILCSNDDIVNAQLPASCLSKAGESCDNFTCQYGYERNPDITSLNCSDSGVWNHNLYTLCIETLCERNFTNGAVAETCGDNVGDSCNNITCNYGFQASETVNQFNCTKDGTWNYNLTSLCIETLCERNFTNGAVAVTCENKVGDSCHNITCNYGFQAADFVDQFNCKEDGTWNYNLTSLCTETLCERNFTNGAVAAACGMKVGDSCDNITCNYGFQAADNIGLFNCTEDGTWDYNMTSLCIETICERNFTDGAVAETCENRVGESCNNITCNYGFQAAKTIDQFYCTEDGTWNYSISSLCIETLCERNFTNGAIAGTCGDKVGDICNNITCSYGFQTANDIDQFNCTEDGTWNYNLTSLCTETLCERNYTNGAVSSTCGNKVGDSCDNITCNYGFQASENVGLFNCTEDGTWDYNMSSVCIEIICNSTDIVNAALPANCTSKAGEFCDSYTCNYGYKRNPDVVSLECTDAGVWNHNLSTLCIETLCPRNISNGELAASCGLRVGDSCDNFTCSSGYEKEAGVDTFNCTETGTWSYNVPLLCKEIFCPGNISNGALPSDCESKAGESCDFTCNLGYKRRTGITSLTCSDSATWSSNLSSLCIEASCSRNISNGVLSDNCSTEANATCNDVICNQGYTRNDDIVSLVCSGAGSWDYKIFFQCDTMTSAIDCHVTPPDETLLTYWIDEIGDTCGYPICNEKYRQLDINESVVCMSDANWKVYSAVLCSASDCSGGQSREYTYSISIWVVTGLGFIIINT